LTNVYKFVVTMVSLKANTCCKQLVYSTMKEIWDGWNHKEKNRK